MSKKRRKPSGNTDLHRRRELEARQKVKEYEEALGPNATPDLKRLITAYGALVDRCDPIGARPLDANPNRERWDRPDPGAATRSFRSAKRGVDRQLGRLADRVEAALLDPGWRPPRGLRCPAGDCGRTGRPGDRFCSWCGATYEKEQV